MKFIKIDNFVGKVYSPIALADSPKKHPCNDCRMCQWCSDNKCVRCVHTQNASNAMPDRP